MFISIGVVIVAFILGYFTDFKTKKRKNEKMEILQVCKNALADLEGIMPEFEPDGDRKHSGWTTIEELKGVITELES